jgi:sensor histidine kinase YesM
MLVLCVVLVLGVWISISQAETAKVKSYEYVVGPQQTDMGRMIQAYENLSTQYLSLVQQNLTLMAQRDQQMLTKMSSMEKKIDQLNTKIDELQKQLKQQ